MLLECNGLVKKYMSKTAIDNLSLNIERGRIYALLGPNGSGKTTLMKIAAGLVKPNSGRIAFCGYPIGVESKKRVAYMSTEPFFYQFMTINDVGKYYEDFFEDFDNNKYDDLLERMELDKKTNVKTLSSGLAAKLKIAATLARKSELYMLDEPLNGVDILSRDVIINLITRSCGENKSIVVSTHLVSEIEKILDSLIFLKDGTIALAGDAEELRMSRCTSVEGIYKEVFGND